MKKEVSGIWDIVFKTVLYGSNEELTKWFTNRLFDRHFKNINIKSSEQRAHMITSKIRHTDVSLEIDDDIICDIELNRSYTDYLHARNFSYIANMYVDYVKKNKQYDTKHTYYLIDITKNLGSKNEQEMYRSYIQDSFGHRYLQNFVILENNVDKIMSHWYHKDNLVPKYAHIIMLNLGKDELKELIDYKGLGEDTRYYITKYREEIIKMEKNDWYTPLFTPEEEEIVIRNTERSIGEQKGMEKGLEKGIEKGIKQTQMETIKNMAREKFKPDIIAKCVGLPINKVNKILSNIIL